MAEESTASATETAEQGLNDVAAGTALPDASAANDGVVDDNKKATTSTDAGRKEGSKDDAATPDASASTDKQDAKSKEGDKDAQGKADKTDPADKPIKDWSKVKIEFPEDAPIDKQALGDFGKEAVKLGLTENQAKSLVNFQLELIAQQRERLMEAGMKELQKSWGGKMSENRQAVLTMLANVDRQMGEGNRFTKALDACGATCFPAVCEGLFYLAQSISEDSMGRGGAAGGADHKETAEEALQAEWEKARGKRL